MNRIKILIDGEVSINDIEDTILELHLFKHQIRKEIHNSNMDYIAEEIKENILNNNMQTYTKALQKIQTHTKDIKKDVAKGRKNTKTYKKHDIDLSLE